MIPVNNAITVALAAIVITAAAVVWVCRGYWRARAEDAYQDGHAAGIATQIGRQHRALTRGQAEDKRVLDAYLARLGRPAPDTDQTEVIVASLTTAAPRHAIAAPPGVLPFPEALPPGLREYAADCLTRYDQQKRSMIA